MGCQRARVADNRETTALDFATYGPQTGAAMFTVRRPESSESEAVAELVLQSDCGLVPALFGDNARALLAHLQTAKANPYSHENTLVILDQNFPGAIVGSFVGSFARATRAAQLHTAVLLMKWYGLGFMARLLNLARAGKAMADLGPGDFYLSHIAIVPEMRGRGAGKELLLAGEKWAAAAGAHKMTLDVEEHNEHARAFYDRFGYHPVSAVRIGLGSLGVFSFIRMAKAL